MVPVNPTPSMNECWVKKHHNHRQGDNQRTGHQVGPLHVVSPAEQAQAEPESLKGLVEQEDQRSQKVVPGGLERENRQGCIMEDFTM